jgi:hypothetical protein
MIGMTEHLPKQAGDSEFKTPSTRPPKAPLSKNSSYIQNVMSMAIILPEVKHSRIFPTHAVRLLIMLFPNCMQF